MNAKERFIFFQVINLSLKLFAMMNIQNNKNTIFVFKSFSADVIFSSAFKNKYYVFIILNIINLCFSYSLRNKLKKKRRYFWTIKRSAQMQVKSLWQRLFLLISDNLSLIKYSDSYFQFQFIYLLLIGIFQFKICFFHVLTK